MKTGFLAIFLSLAFWPGTAKCCTGLSPYDQEVVKDLARIAAVSAKPESALWPGYSPFFEPLAIQFADGIKLLINHPKPPADYKQLKEACPDLGATIHGDLIFVGPKEGLFPQLLNNVPINAVNVFGILDKGHDTAANFTALVTHEVFHQFQNKYFQLNKAAVSDEIGAESLAGEYTERLLLARALYSKNEAWKSEFLARRKARYKKEDKRLIAMESREEMAEGTASYVEFLALSVLMQPGKKNTELMKDLVAAKLFPKMLPYNKFPFYGSGAALCLLLDRGGGNWQKEIEKGTPLFDAAEAMSAQAPGKDHYFKPFFTLAKDEAEWASEKKKEILAGFRDPEASRLVLSFQTKGGQTNYTGDVNTNYQIDANTSLFYVDYMEARIGADFKLIAEKSFIMLSGQEADKDGFYKCRYELPLFQPERAAILLDAEPVAGDVVSKPFREITLKTGNLNLKVKSKGVFTRQGKTLSVTFGRLD